MKYKLMFIVLGMVIWSGCNDEGSLTPTETPEVSYTLPQGSHDYDTKIVDWNERCGFFILYKFEPKDVYWNVTNWGEAGIVDEYSGLTAVPADEAYVGKLVDVLERRFLGFYPDTLLQRCMPIKVLLCNDLYITKKGRPLREDLNFGLDFLALNGANEDFKLKTPHQIDLIKDSLHITFINELINRKKMIQSEEFFKVSTYMEEEVTKGDMYALGYLASTWSKVDKSSDWKNFLKAIIKNPYGYLTAEPADGDFTFKGMLHEKKDVNGLVRKKYDIMVNHFKKQYGIDLQAMGDSKEPVVD